MRKNSKIKVTAEKCCSVGQQEYSKQIQYIGEYGDAVINVYTVFPGVRLLYNSVHLNEIKQSTKSTGTRIEIHYCTEGRLERRSGEDYFFLAPGDLSVSIRNISESQYVFPLNHYHGISVLIDNETAPHCFSCFLQDADITPEQIVRRLCGDSARFILHSDRRFDHVFNELKSVPDSFKKGYFKIKVLEILYLLSMTEPEENNAFNSILPKSQVLTAKKAAEYLEKNIHTPVNVGILAKECGSSQTYLQTCIKNVYGMTVSSFIRSLKMQKAAWELVSSDKKIISIGVDLGYENASKFSSAFARIMGETPKEYRKNHSSKRSDK